MTGKITHKISPVITQAYSSSKMQTWYNWKIKKQNNKEERRMAESHLTVFLWNAAVCSLTFSNIDSISLFLLSPVLHTRCIRFVKEVWGHSPTLDWHAFPQIKQMVVKLVLSMKENFLLVSAGYLSINAYFKEMCLAC